MTRILVVDDNPTTQRMLVYVVESQGYETVRANDGTEAVECLAQDTFELVISDIKMPKMDGMALLDHIRSNAETATIPVLLLTARLDAYDEDVASGDQRTTFMTKPLASADLATMVAEMLAASAEDGEQP